MAVKGKISLKQLLKKEFANSKVFQNLAYGAVKKKADALKKKTMAEFDKHEVTKELERGTSGRNSLLLGGRGNFFGFLGFNQGERPVEIVRNVLEQRINLKSNKGKLKKVTKKQPFILYIVSCSRLLWLLLSVLHHFSYTQNKMFSPHILYQSAYSCC